MIVSTLLVLVALALTAVAVTTLWWQMHAWWLPGHDDRARYPAAQDSYLDLTSDPPARRPVVRHSFSLVMPCREEEEPVMRATLDALLAQSHPHVEVIISVGHDDDATVETAHRLAAGDDRVRVSVNHDPVGTKNKPKQLNDALLMCRNEVVGIFDAESLAAPDLLLNVDRVLTERHADVVQGAVHLMNYRDSWFSLRNCMEYRIWFRSRLHGHALSGFIPLGGNTVFVRRELLLEVGGWDGECLAEDCDLGVRLSTRGRRIEVAYDPTLVTREETPERIPQLVKQRTRWALGFMQVLAKGEWKQLPTRSRRLHAWWTLVQQHAVAFAGIVLPLAVLTAFLVEVPPLVVLVTLLPLVPTLAMLAFEVLILREWDEEMALGVRWRDYVRLVVSMPFYQVLLGVAVLRALVKYVTGDFAWEKTAHVGSHLTPHAVDDGTARDRVEVAA
ncbi:glycosyltransferase [Aquipuribacter sp. SD81]|uniref:glycosyltransferase n=1 Tax=Aquipuribacter sp. SD81 TaxID=3127703 RepID=UPI003015CDCA